MTSAAVMVQACEAAIDDLAARAGLSRHALAVAAGLDPSTLNPSKRTGLRGQGMSMGTVSALLTASGVTPAEWARIVERRARELEGRR